MKKVLILAGVAALASVSFAQVFPGQNLEKKTLHFGGNNAVQATAAPVFSAMSPSYTGFAAATGLLGFDDYTASPNAAFPLTEMRFVGGVSAIGGTIQFDFADSVGTPVASFTVSFPVAGYYIWTIDDLGGLGITLPGSGRLALTATGASIGRWYLSTSAPTLGTENRTGYGSLTTHSHRFELSTVPEPSSVIALIGGLGFMAARRRKA